MVVSRAAIAVVCGIALATAEIQNPFSEEFISLINSKQNSWKAGKAFPLRTTYAHLKSLVNSFKAKDNIDILQQVNFLEDEDDYDLLPQVKHDPELIKNLPEKFDPREKWPKCPSLNEIKDQGPCISAWALAPVQVMTDRYCIYSNGTQHFEFSAQDVLTCCTRCGDGCRLGNPLTVWDYWKRNGIVSGGNYNSSQGCRPYTVPTCDTLNIIPELMTPCGPLIKTPFCFKSCESSYNVDYENDKHYAKQAYGVYGEDNIKAELYLKGPVVAFFQVYTDFFTYKKGVYKNTAGESEGLHFGKIIGWGVENGVKYWLMANTWKNGWGENGFFKFLRGEDHCRIESHCSTAEPIIVQNSDGNH